MNGTGMSNKLKSIPHEKLKPIPGLNDLPEDMSKILYLQVMLFKIANINRQSESDEWFLMVQREGKQQYAI